MLIIYTGDETVRQHGETLFASAKLLREVYLVLDAPRGYALRTLADLPRPVLVVTGVSTSPYLQDLLDLRPEGLLARPTSPQEVLTGLERISTGERFYEGPFLENRLQPCERAVLRHLAFGLENSEIAHILSVSPRTVDNRITALKEKLKIRNRVELALFYLGIHSRLQDCEKLTLQT